MKIVKTLAVLILTIAFVSCNTQSANQKSLKTELDSASYALGLNMSSQIKANFENINRDLYIQGFQNGLDSVKTLIAQKDVNKILNTYFQKIQKEKMKAQRAAAIKAAEEKFGAVKKEGEEFLMKNKTQKGVKTTASGLQYIVLKQGKGAKPSITSRVKVHYHGTLIDGTVFDSSVDRKMPYTTFVNQVIQGWIEGLQLMNVGSKYKFFVPQELAYGATPREGVIKPFMPLIFEVELLEIIKTK